ncbi:MAG TPA: nucleotidyltransferase family protein [Polyangiaceae bacterium]|nr:nucleotidyltransferase family protein [Polyangiaceae bacterium]
MKPQTLAPRSRPTPELRRYATAVLAREVLRDVAGLLHARGIAVMPLKGVLFQMLLYSADPAARVLTDIDVLVPPRQFEDAILALREAGFQPRSAGRSLIEVALQSPRGMTLDLHRRLFSVGRYKLSTHDLFQRSSLDERLLGVPLQLAHPHDTAAHLIGKFVSDHEFQSALFQQTASRELSSQDSRARLQELLAWCEYCQIQPRRLAQHLRSTGLARAARYVFGRGHELTGDPFFARALQALPRDRFGHVWERSARILIPELSQTALASIPAHLLDSSVARGGASLLLSVVQRCRHAWLARQRGTRGGYWSPFFAEQNS